MDPKEYIRREEATSTISEQPRVMGISLLKSIAKYKAPCGEPFIEKIFKYIAQYLLNGKDPLNPGIALNITKKEVLLSVTCYLWDAIRENEKLLSNVE